MVDAELLEILRCPYCVSGETRRTDKENPGQLDLVREESWLVCVDCGRKYPIRDDIPVMLIKVGEKWMDTEIDDLPVPPPPTEDV
ncbi:MAG: Trm112 family protein [Anaerolineae bacterium]